MSELNDIFPPAKCLNVSRQTKAWRDGRAALLPLIPHTHGAALPEGRNGPGFHPTI